MGLQPAPPGRLFKGSRAGGGGKAGRGGGVRPGGGRAAGPAAGGRGADHPDRRAGAGALRSGGGGAPGSLGAGGGPGWKRGAEGRNPAVPDEPAGRPEALRGEPELEGLPASARNGGGGSGRPTLVRGRPAFREAWRPTCGCWPGCHGGHGRRGGNSSCRDAARRRCRRSFLRYESAGPGAAGPEHARGRAQPADHGRADRRRAAGGLPQPGPAAADHSRARAPGHGPSGPLRRGCGRSRRSARPGNRRHPPLRARGGTARGGGRGGGELGRRLRRPGAAARRAGRHRGGPAGSA